MMKEIDTEYLAELIRQTQVQNNGISYEVRKKGLPKGLMINGSYVSFEYLQEKSSLVDSLLTTIHNDILMKSGKLRKLEN